ncbi:hypothetical protein DMH01_19145 [Amycolatopsis sp. WAC 04182]|uniref:hypothetical protein n=1 Tax=Amycolatopsis sp. WAC 04182 TaxID=2203198 RepID=UPI000F7B1099|nr:hypothetical protein [Amycolatopsis sp. WAC 04182]RSN61331.1 hypothetical protein DMH01_19145 [Amycolatopsis sp. WAC 04182]
MADDEDVTPEEGADEPEETGAEPQEPDAPPEPAPATEPTPPGDTKESAPEEEKQDTDPATWREVNQNFDEALRALLGDGGLRLGGPGTNNIFFGTTSVATLGDNHASGAPGRFEATLRSGPVSSTLLDRIRASFVEPAGYQRLKDALESRQLVFVRARSGSGRTTTALRLLDQTCRTGVRKLDPDTRLKALGADDFEDSHGYLLESLDPDQAAGLRLFHAEKLSQLMRDKGCMMIVIVGETVPLPPREVDDFVIDELGTIEPRTLLTRHVEWGLRGSSIESTAGALLSRPDVKEIIAEITEDVPPRELAELGALLVEVAHDRIDLERVRERYSRVTQTGFLEWFDEQSDPEQRAFVIALAVLNNETVTLVSDAAAILAKRIKAVEVPRRFDRAKPLFTTSLTQRLEAAKAELVQDTLKLKYGDVAVRKVRFNDDRFPRWLLDHICAQYSEEFEIVREWLTELGEQNNDRLSMRAAVAVGLLSVYDFPSIYSKIISAWATTDSYDPRWAAAAALQLPSRDPALSRLIGRLLTDWIKKPTMPMVLRRTAAQALGTTEAMSPEKVLSLLKYAARQDDLVLSFMIAESICRLFRQPEQRPAVLRALLNWTADEKFPQRRETGLRALIYISRFMDDVEVVESAEEWPIFLWVADQDADQRQQVLTLFGRVLIAAGFMHGGYARINNWVRRARRDQTLRAPLARFLYDVGRESGELESIREHLEYLASMKRSLAGTVRTLLLHFDERIVK